jgi:hypothetical protein
MAMTSDNVATSSTEPGQTADLLIRLGYATCLVLFPLLWAVFAGTALHPDPAGETSVEQVRAVADAGEAWRQVHLVLAGASLLGIGAVLALRSLIPRGGRLSVIASTGAAMGVAAAGLVAGIVVMEAMLVAPVAEACAADSTCLSPANETFLTEFADAAWNDITVLSIAAGTLMFSLGTLAVLGWRTKTIRAWEVALMVVGIVGVYATNTVLHGDAKYGLALVLVASTSIGIRIARRSHG